MPYAVTHFLVALFLVGFWRDYFIKDKKKFPLHYVLIGGLAGVLPDFDIFVYYFVNFFGYELQEVHRTFTHTLLFPLLFLFLGFSSYGFRNQKLGIHHLKLRNIFIVLSFGTLIHFALDMLFSGSVMPFYPISQFSIGFNAFDYILPLSWRSSFLYVLDAALLVIWITYLEVKHKVSDFI